MIQIVVMNISTTWFQVVASIKSKHVGGTFSKKNKCMHLISSLVSSILFVVSKNDSFTVHL